ncbi:hypothetical protein HK098_002652 [Nowakowskiella sp. JEL0407]|nr:hypothetical protein HK098_002652 [Nowakowskiella sp. JEL0407]
MDSQETPHEQLNSIAFSQQTQRQEIILRTQHERENDLKSYTNTLNSINEVITHERELAYTKEQTWQGESTSAQNPELLSTSLVTSPTAVTHWSDMYSELLNSGTNSLDASSRKNSLESSESIQNEIYTQTTTDPKTIPIAIQPQKIQQRTASLSQNSILLSHFSSSLQGGVSPIGSLPGSPAQFTHALSANLGTGQLASQLPWSGTGSLAMYPQGGDGTSTPAGSLRRQVKGILNQKNEIGPKIVIFMVGLPARGKSYICKKLTRYLSWSGYNTKVFNVGNKRRTKVVPSPVLAAATSPANSSLGLDSNHLTAEPLRATSPEKVETSHDASFFDPSNKDASNLRDEIAMEVLEELIEWLKGGGKIAVHDATNSNLARRQKLLARISQEKNITALFIESICTDPEILSTNILMKTKSPDYAHLPQAVAIADFTSRMMNYEKSYDTISEHEEESGVSFIKIYNVGRKVVAANIKGFIQSQCVFYLMQIHIKARCIWLTRHGESVYNLYGRIGGDPPLTEKGKRYAKALTDFIKNEQEVANKSRGTVRVRKEDSKEGLREIISKAVSKRRRESLDIFGTDTSQVLQIWTSTLRRSLESVEYFHELNDNEEEIEIKHLKQLDELYAGMCENLTFKEIEKNYPGEFSARVAMKLTYRYPGPGGESYMDVIERVRPIIVELERCETDVLLVTHNVVTRIMLSYFAGISLDEMPTLDIPLHTLYKVVPKPYGADLVKYKWVEESNTFVMEGNKKTEKGGMKSPIHILEKRGDLLVAVSNSKFTIFLNNEPTGQSPESAIKFIITSLKIHPTLPLIAYIQDKHLSLYNFDTKVVTTVITQKRGTCVDFIGNKVLLADKFGDVYSYDSPSLENPKLLLGHVSIITDICVLNGGTHIVTADRDEKIRVSRYPYAFEIEGFCFGHTSFITSLVTSKSNPNLLVSGGGDKCLYTHVLSSTTNAPFSILQKFSIPETISTSPITKIKSFDNKLAVIFEKSNKVMIASVGEQNGVVVDGEISVTGGNVLTVEIDGNGVFTSCLRDEEGGFSVEYYRKMETGYILDEKLSTQFSLAQIDEVETLFDYFGFMKTLRKVEDDGTPRKSEWFNTKRGRKLGAKKRKFTAK